MIENGVFIIIRFGVEHKNEKFIWYIAKHTVKNGKKNADFDQNLQQHVSIVYCFDLLILLPILLKAY